MQRSPCGLGDRKDVRPSVKCLDCDKNESKRWTAYVARKPLKGPQKRKLTIFRIKNWAWRACYKVSVCGNFQWQSCKAFTCLSNPAQMVGGGRPLLPEILGHKWPTHLKNADFQAIFAHSDLTIALSEKNSVITNRKSAMGFPMSLRWTAYISPKPPKERFKNAKWLFFI